MSTPRYIHGHTPSNTTNSNYNRGQHLNVGSTISVPSSVPLSSSRRLSTVRLGADLLGNSPSTRSLHPSIYNQHSGGLTVPGTPNALGTGRPDSIYSTSNGSSQNQILIDADNPSFQSNTKDQRIINDQTSQYFTDDLTSAGGDISRSIKSKTQHRQSSSLKRTKSSSELLNQRRESTASALNVPGGFRREFILNKARERAILNDEELKQVPFLTKNFMEFLYIYGHFAGESFEEDFELTDESAVLSWDENTPLINRAANIKLYEAKGTTSTLKAFLIMLKSFIGTGIIFLPKGFANGGLLFSITMLIIFGVYSYYCYYILVMSKTATQVSSFGDIGSKLYGGWMKSLILFSLVLTQIGFGCAYIIFTSANLSAFVKNVTSYDIDYKYYFIFQTVIFIPLSFIRNVAKLSFSSLIANGLIFGGLGIILIFTVKELFDNGIKPVELFINKSQFSLFIGTAIFAFEGIGLIIPIQDSMRNPEKFPMVLLFVIITITLLMVTVATIGYLAYGEDVQTAILLNLPQSNFFVNLIQFLYSVAILLSTPLQLFPAIGIIEKRLFKRSESGKFDPKVKWHKNFLRTAFVLLCMSIAWFGANDLDKFVSFVGCFACIPLVYMYPPLLHYKSCTLGDRRAQIIDIVLVIVGSIAMLYTSYEIMFT